ncbi:MAG: arsenate reductase ArsC [Sedimentisphaerales bacterium]|nr:arsenate reductase ArsC [Sedimentisphaerales bacterium]
MSENKSKIKVLFLCTGNSCRSQMAEGWAKHLKDDVVDAYSAGIRPSSVSSRAIKVMAEAGVDISDHKSKHVGEFKGGDFDYVVTLCDNAAENCPVFPGKAKIIHKPFEDPHLATGSEETVLATFRRIRDQIKAFVEKMPGNLFEDGAK